MDARSIGANSDAGEGEGESVEKTNHESRTECVVGQPDPLRLRHARKMTRSLLTMSDSCTDDYRATDDRSKGNGGPRVPSCLHGE